MVSALLRRYPLPIGYVGTLACISLIYAHALPAAGRRSLVSWSSTNVANLDVRPLTTLVASAFLSVDPLIVWAVLTTLALSLLVRRLGNLRSAIVIATAHVAGTLVSEGIAAVRVAIGAAPSALRHIADVGPSYVTVSALAAAAVCGRGTAPRLAALAGWLALAPFLFERIQDFDVAAVGHVVATLTGGLLGLAHRRAGTSAPGAPSHSGRGSGLIPSRRAA